MKRPSPPALGGKNVRIEQNALARSLTSATGRRINVRDNHTVALLLEAAIRGAFEHLPRLASARAIRSV
jgi:hypothetical protein